ncbi:MAG: PAS domain S-box protein, partial [Deltaproteobacteria bacterium]|nr:PAS domain S-box protein [Deltaproteobacteria bacterium]
MAAEILSELTKMQRTAEQSKTECRPTNVLESIPDGFYALDREWQFTYLNVKAEQFLRRKREELLGKNVWKEFPETVDSVLYKEYHRAMAEQVVVKFDMFYPPSTIWFEIHAYPSQDGLSVYFHDITERKWIQEALRESEERYRTIFAASPDYIYLTDTEGHILDANPALLNRAKLSLEQIRQKSFMDFFAGDNLEALLQAVAQLKNGQEIKGLEVRARNAQGEIFEYEVNATPLKENGVVTKCLSLARDITARKWIEEALRESEERYRSLFENANDAIVSGTLDGTITSVNQGL